MPVGTTIMMGAEIIGIRISLDFDRLSGLGMFVPHYWPFFVDETEVLFPPVEIAPQPGWGNVLPMANKIVVA